MKYYPELSMSDKLKINRWSKQGKTTKEIASLLNTTYHHVYMFMKRTKEITSYKSRF